MRIGFVGLGIMGAPMAENLLKNGYSLTVNDIEEKAVARLVAKGAESGSYADIGRSDVIFLMLPGGKICQSVLFQTGLCDAIKRGAIVCDLSSQLPEEAERAAAGLKEKGIRYADAPVTGGEPKAISGELSILVGAEEKDFDTLLPLLSAMGKKITRVGGIGSGNAVKLANQIITNVTIGAIAEAVNLAAGAGVSPETLFDAIRDGAAGSAMLNTRAAKIAKKDYAPGAKISINQKDMGNVLTFAEGKGIDLPLAKSYYHTLCRLSEAGLDGLDVSAVPEYYLKGIGG